jgi:LDH2 family malate/lactate/ureidoglycolate dehydrogenase
MIEETRVHAADLREFTKGVFIAAGVPSEDATLEAEVLVWANLRGVDSHGVLRIPSYVEMIGRGDMNPRPTIRVEKETAATVLIDGDRALGPVVTTVAMRRAIDKAREAGIGWAVIRNTTHQGAMAYYALMAVEAGMAGIAIVCSPPNMAPFGARAAGVHNSPISIAVPAGRHRPLCVDMAGSSAWLGTRASRCLLVGRSTRRGSPRPMRAGRRSSCRSAAPRARGSPRCSRRSRV